MSISGPESPFKVTWSASPRQVDAAGAVEAFKNTAQPLLIPVIESTFSDEIAAQRQSIRNIQTNFDQAPSEENAVKRTTLKEKIADLATFAKAHPWLTTGFVIALILVALTAYLTVEAFLGHTSIALFHAHPEIGGGLTFMCIYYSIYLINLCRRASVKDELEAHIHAHNDFASKISTDKQINIKKLTEISNHEIEQMRKRERATENELHKAYEACEAEYKQALATLENIQAYKAQAWDLTKYHAKDMPQPTQAVLEKTLDDLGYVIRKGGELLKEGPTGMIFPSTGTSPLTPQFIWEETTLNFPPQNTEKMRKNAEKAKAFSEKMVETFAAIGPFLKESPFTAGMFVAGFLMCAIAGMALYFYFHGASNLFFLGSVSLTTITPMLIYGISLIYEGYNSATINSLTKDLKNLKTETDTRKKLLEEQQNQLNVIDQTVKKTKKTFEKKWNSMIEYETKCLNSNKELLRNAEVSTWSATEKAAATLINALTPIYPDVSGTEVQRVISGVANGAKT